MNPAAIWTWNVSYRGVSYVASVIQDPGAPTTGWLKVMRLGRPYLLENQVSLPGGTFTATDAANWAAQAQARINMQAGV